jgi:hypothetical protein
MKNIIPEGRDLQQLLEAAIEEQRAKQPTEAPSGTVVVAGDVLDTHHPSLPGTVLVRFLDDQSVQHEDWLEAERHLTLVKGDRVLVTRPMGFQDWFVTGALGRRTQAARAEAPAQLLRLAPGESLTVQAHDGSPLVTLHQGPEGPRLEVSQENLEISAKQTLRLSAGTIELVSREGGIALNTEGEAVVRASIIRLN